MTGPPNLTARLRARPGGAMRGRPHTARELLTLIGRAVLWLTVAVVLIRGLGSIAATEPTPAPRGSDRERVASWPNDAARAFAVEFATAYLTYSPTQEPGATTLEAFAAPELVGSLAPRFADQDESRALVRSVGLAQVVGTVQLDERHALVTVAATLTGPGRLRRLVTVPVARDVHGGLVVYDLPSFAPAPARATASAPAGEPLLGGEREAITDVLSPFLRAYLAGDTEGLRYLVPAEKRVPAVGGLELVELGSVAEVAPAADGARERVVLVTVQAREVGSRAIYALRYRVRLVRRDRWYVAEINGPARRPR
jgi:hypothetical protein